MKRNIILGVVVVLLIGAAFFGGTCFAKSSTTAIGPGGTRGAGGPMANMTDEERAKLDSMTDTERQAYFQEQMGSQAASGTVGPRGGGGGLVTGDVIEVATDTITVKVGTNSQTIYIDDSTVIGYEEGAGTMAAGSSILVFSEPSADNVVTAQAILVKK